MIVDLGYRGVDAVNPGVQTIHRGQYETISDHANQRLERRQAIEPSIGHPKADHRTDRCWPQGAAGDALHALSWAAGSNIRRLMRATARRGPRGLFAPWRRWLRMRCSRCTSRCCGRRGRQRAATQAAARRLRSAGRCRLWLDEICRADEAAVRAIPRLWSTAERRFRWSIHGPNRPVHRRPADRPQRHITSRCQLSGRATPWAALFKLKRLFMNQIKRSIRPFHRRFIAPIVIGIAAVAALVACGGGGTETGSQTTAAARLAKALAFRPTAQSALPGDPDWATEAACTEASDFITIDGATDPDMALKSRHTYCMLLGALPQTIEVDLMRNADDTGWEYFEPGAGRPPTTFTVGTVELQTQFQSYGPDNGLYKTHKLNFIVKSFVPDANFPLPTSGLTLKIAPRMGCQPLAYGSGASNGTCTNVDQFNASVALQDGGEGASAEVKVGFAWDFSEGDGNYSWASFKVALNGATYLINDVPRPSGAGPFVVATDSSAASMVAQEIRCDLVLSSGGACVMPKAAAVVVMDTSADPVLQEAADHVYEAQHTLSAGQTILSPGLFALKPGTRAVADESGGSQFQGLQREMDEGQRKANRNAACGEKSETSLINVRPYQGSESCPTIDSPGCSCDEYPFAASKSGAAYAPDSASVKGILLTSNAKGGTVFGTIMSTQRVLRPEAYQDKFWVVRK